MIHSGFGNGAFAIGTLVDFSGGGHFVHHQSSYQNDNLILSPEGFSVKGHFDPLPLQVIKMMPMEYSAQ